MAKKQKKRSNAWYWFYEEFFGRTEYEMWHDGIRPEVVKDLKGEEKAEAEELLLKEAKNGAQWAATALGIMKSKKAVPILKELLEECPHILRIRMADALEQIEENGEYLPILIEELSIAPTPYDRLEAAMNLRKYPTVDVIKALYKGLEDEDYLVRYHSAESLLSIHGLEPDISENEEIFPYICANKEENAHLSREEQSAQAIKLLKQELKQKKFKPYLS